MSFIYDDQNLINELLKSALNFENKFSKHGQTAPIVSDDNFTTLFQLINDLENKINNPNNNPQISHEGVAGSTANLASKDLINLGSLIQFLAGNAITVDSKRIAYLQTSDAEDAPSGYKYLKLEPSPGAITNPNRSNIQQVSFVDTNLLSIYLQSLVSDLHKTPNPTTGLFLKHIIDEANNQLGTNLNMRVPAAQIGQTEQTGQAKQNGQPEQNTNQTQQNIQDAFERVMAVLPFSNDFINFKAINSFLTSYMRFVQAVQQGGEIFPTIQNAQNLISQAVSMTQGGDTNISLQLGYADIARMIKPPAQTNYVSFINVMQNAMQATFTVMNDLYTDWIQNPRVVHVDDNQKEAAEQQILGSNSIYQRNLEQLNEWLGDTERVVKYVH